MRHVIVMSGVSGSGKSTYIQEKILGRTKDGTRTTWSQDYHSVVVVSADNYFYNAEGDYAFLPAKIGEAHAACFREFIEALQSDIALILVDNTNTTVEEIAPYMLGAQAFGYTSELITLYKSGAELDLCAQRNLHGVPLATIISQRDTLDERKLPSWWKHTWI